MDKSEQINELARALAKAQLTFKPVRKVSDNPYYDSKYADLATLISATQPSLAENGLVVVQAPIVKLEEQKAGVSTMLAHASGQWLTDDLLLPATMKTREGIRFDAQSVGSAISYARRYAYQSMVGVTGDVDDDGEAAVGHENGSKAAQQQVADRKKAEHAAKTAPAQAARTQAQPATATRTQAQPPPAEQERVAARERLELEPLNEPYLGMVGLRGNNAINILRSEGYDPGKGDLAMLSWLDGPKCWAVDRDGVNALGAVCEKCHIEMSLALPSNGKPGPMAPVPANVPPYNPPQESGHPVIKSCAARTMRKSGKKFLSVMYDGHECSCFDSALWDAITAGTNKPADLIVEEREKDGKTYYNVVGIRRIGGREYENNVPVRTTNDVGSQTSFY